VKLSSQHTTLQQIQQGTYQPWRRGQRHQEQSSNQGPYYRSERRYGSFYRTIALPEGTDPDSASASFRDGVLEIQLDQPRAQQRGRTLEIGDGSSGRKNG